jgi:hypothetical protein
VVIQPRVYRGLMLGAEGEVRDLNPCGPDHRAL